jgi:hypothetical protein
VSGTLAVGNGGTGLTSLTANYVPYGNGTSAFSSASTFQADGTRLSVGGALQSGISLYTNAASGDNKVRFDASAGTTSSFMAFVNTTVSSFGTENSSGGNIVASSSPYATVVANSGAYPVQIGVNNTVTWEFTTAGNLAVKTSGKGIDFSVTAGTGTSELLADYEEGTWTPVLQSWTIVGTSPAVTGSYTKIGRQVYLYGQIAPVGGTVSYAAAAGTSYVNGLPFAVGFNSAVVWTDASNAANVLATNLVNTGNNIYAPNITATGDVIIFVCNYSV